MTNLFGLKGFLLIHKNEILIFICNISLDVHSSTGNRTAYIAWWKTIKIFNLIFIFRGLQLGHKKRFWAESSFKTVVYLPVDVTVKNTFTQIHKTLVTVEQ